MKKISLTNLNEYSQLTHSEHSSSSCSVAKRRFAHHCSGFTLIELMISIALGLIIVAAAIQLFITGLTSYKLQATKSNGPYPEQCKFGSKLYY